MSNTIELLESIGRNAALRHATREELLRVLQAMDAGEHLRRAVVTGEREHLQSELGEQGANKVNHNVNEGGCDPGEESAEAPLAEPADDDAPAHPAK
jgi:hypothetical protein